MSFTGVFMIVAFNDFDVLVEPEDAACQEERLRDIVEQAGGHIIDFDHLVSYEGDATHDEQHRTGVLRNLKACVFHGRQITVLLLNFFSFPVFAEQKVNDSTQYLQNDFPCLVHNSVFLKVNK